MLATKSYGLNFMNLITHAFTTPYCQGTAIDALIVLLIAVMVFLAAVVRVAWREFIEKAKK